MTTVLPPFHPPINGADRCPVASVQKDPTPAYASDLERWNALQHLDKPSGDKAIFTLGTRLSKLAMVQTNLVKDQLEQEWGDKLEVRIYGMVSWR